MEPKLNEKLSIGIYVKPFTRSTITSTLQICLIISVLFLPNFVECNVVRRNSVDEILKSVKSLQDNCQQWTTRSMAEETFMESLASRLSLTEAKLENSIANIKYGETQRLMESKLSLVERLVENNFDRLARKLEEMSETIRGLQTMVIINHNSTEEKIRKILNSVNGLLNDQTSNGRTSTLSSDSVSEIQGFLEQKLINTEKLVNRHVTLVKDEIKELLVDLKMKSWTNELTSGVESVDNVDIVETVNQMRSDVSRKVDKIENQLKFAHQELNFKLDNQLGILKNISEKRSTRNTTDYLSCQTSSKESRSEESSTSSSASIELMTTTVEPSNNTISDSTQVHQILIDYSFKNRRCQIMPNKTSKADCDAIPFKTSWKTCADIYNDNITCDGIYLIMMEPRPSRVWCDMIDNGGGWMVILRRGNFYNKPTLISFNQNWFLYKYGFGDQKDEYWLGNEHIHRLTSLIPHQLQIDLESYDGQCISLDYGHFKIDSEDKAYRLIVADARGPHAVIGEQLLLYNNSAFNTRDRVNSRNSLRCGHFYGGWWFNGFACFEIFLTGELDGKDNHKGQLPGIHWYSWKPNKALKAVQMKIRPILK